MRSAGVSKVAHESALQRMTQAGATPITVLGLACELQRDWGRPGARSAARGDARVLRQAKTKGIAVPAQDVGA